MRGCSRRAAVGFLAALCGLVPLKFSQPVILRDFGFTPMGWLDWLFSAWPNVLFYALMAAAALVVIPFSLDLSWKGRGGRVLLPPLAFLAVQGLAGLASVDGTMSWRVLALFLALAMGWCLGACLVRDERDLGWIALGWLIGGFLVGWSGYSQATGGLEETRQYLHLHPELAAGQPMLWEKIESNRIFATFVNPNALGGYIASTIFMIAAWLAVARKSRSIWPWLAGGGGIVLLLFCLWKSQSKGAYAALFAVLLIAVFTLSPRRRLAALLAGAVILVSVLGFALGYGQKAVDKGRKTFAARTDYWKAAWQIGLDHPVLGSGPGTFSLLYPRYKAWEAESTRLVHNNYLQMWSDSGLMGFITFLIWMPGTLAVWWRRWRRTPALERVAPTLAWCACLVFALHSLVDFDLYLISNSWPIFVLLGWLAASEPPDFEGA